MPGELDEPRRPSCRVGLAAEREGLPRPDSRAKRAEHDVHAGHELVELASATRLTELRRRSRRRRSRVGELVPVGEGVTGRQVGVQVFEPKAVEVGLQLGIRGRADPEQIPEEKTSCVKPWRRKTFDGLDRSAEPVVSLEDADAPAVLREERSARERVDSAADEDRVESRHADDSTRLTCHAEICVRFQLDAAPGGRVRAPGLGRRGGPACWRPHEGARALAGGQTLVNVMKARAASPDVLVDLNRLE